MRLDYYKESAGDLVNNNSVVFSFAFSFGVKSIALSKSIPSISSLL